jgi:hypothetical protein
MDLVLRPYVYDCSRLSSSFCESDENEFCNFRMWTLDIGPRKDLVPLSLLLK